MTTLVEARDALAAFIHTNWTAQYPTTPVYWENALRVDLDQVGSMFLRVEIEFNDALQMTFNDVPIRRTFGALYLTLFVKDGEGVRAALACLDYLTNIAKYQRVGGVILKTPTPGRRTYKDGWRSYELYVPFLFD